MKIINITENAETSASLDSASSEIVAIPEIPAPAPSKPRKPAKGKKVKTKVKSPKKGATKVKTKGQKKVKTKGGKVKMTKTHSDTPSTGQSREPFLAKYDLLSKKEKKVVDFLNGDGSGQREPHTISEIAALFVSSADTKKRANSWARNSLRDLVPGGFVEKVERGVYKVSKDGRARLARIPE
jgi:hypothetical protein